MAGPRPAIRTAGPAARPPGRHGRRHTASHAVIRCSTAAVAPSLQCPATATAPPEAAASGARPARRRRPAAAPPRPDPTTV
ncbi:hypothetical protein ISF6_4731 [Piscinibacter sakaiensis]|uniref:Uncharacterized protein n=1 Tax=Piscinibacter sakaiensis TaxID=1547922 RepID=A0A0K8NVZ5_PISS1|nr:hypothetical protein ISF6_4731 [Piscinibacter sakaiensis]